MAKLTESWRRKGEGLGGNYAGKAASCMPYRIWHRCVRVSVDGYSHSNKFYGTEQHTDVAYHKWLNCSPIQITSLARVIEYTLQTSWRRYSLLEATPSSMLAVLQAWFAVAKFRHIYATDVRLEVETTWFWKKYWVSDVENPEMFVTICCCQLTVAPPSILAMLQCIIGKNIAIESWNTD